jgi:hypothetical protein
MPVLGAAFLIGKDAIYKDLNINDSIVKTFFRYLKNSFCLLKFIPIQLIIVLNLIGMTAADRVNNKMYSVLCLSFISFLFVLMLYISGYYVFVDKKVNVIEVVIGMLLKPQILIPVFIIIVLCTSLFSFAFMVILLFTGAFFLFAIEVLILIQMINYKKVTGMLDEKDEFAYLAENSKLHKNAKK